MSLSKIGKIPINVKNKTLYSKERNEKISLSRKGKTWEEIYGKKYANKLRKLVRKGNKGNKHWNWKGGISYNEEINITQTKEWSSWRKKVFARNKYICQKCKKNKSGKLVPHHIINKSENKELIFDVGNGLTFCNDCHIKFHNRFGYKNNNKKQIIKYING